jgi:hypothetical protein
MIRSYVTVSYSNSNIGVPDLHDESAALQKRASTALHGGCVTLSGAVPHHSTSAAAPK